MIPDKVYDILMNLLPMILLFSVVMACMRISYMIISKQKLVLYKELKSLMYLIYCFALFKLVTTSDFESYSNNFIPFHEITRYKVSSVLFYRNVIGNIVLFIPFGYLVTDMIKSEAKKINVFFVSGITLITSLTIELIQMYIGRSFDIDDILLNLVGGICGYLIYKLLHFLYSKVPKKYHTNIFKLIVCVIIIILVISGLYIYYEVNL